MATSSVLTASRPVARRKFEFNLEALRGFAALIVVFHHAIIHQRSLDPAYSPGGVWANPLAGHSSVLLFFILSGYVIGLTNPRPLTRQTIVAYLRKRLVRLYPIYLISLLFALAVAARHYPFTTVAGHFLFLQNAVVPYIFENNPLWSLNNEVLYYLAFIPVSYFALNPGRVCLVAGVVGLVCGTVLHWPYLSSYSFGFVFWTSGLWLAQRNPFVRSNASRWELWGLVLLFVGYEFLNPFMLAVLLLDTKLHLSVAHPAAPSVMFSDLCQLPFCFYLFLRFTDYTFKQARLFLAASVAAAFLYVAYLTQRYGVPSPQITFRLLPVAFVAFGTACWLLAAVRPRPTQEAQLLPALCIKLGTISYGIYVIHFPISILLARITVFSGTGFTYCIRLAVDLVLVLAAGYILELKIQPWFKARLGEKPAGRQVVPT